MNDPSKFLMAVVDDCEALLNYDVDTSDWDWNLKARMLGIRTLLDDAMRQATELHEDTSQRVFCIEVESVIEQRIKVLAKTEADAIERAAEEAEIRFRLTLGKEHDYDVSSSAISLGDESPLDDDADVEINYE